MRIFTVVFVAFGLFAFSELKADEKACPDLARSAKRLLLVTGSGMGAIKAHVRLFQRKSPNGGTWSQVGPVKQAILGRSGLGWGWDQQSLAAAGEPPKHEGDGRTPAGVFKIERAFGFEEVGPGRSYLPLVAHKSYCVDDVQSPYYNQIIDKGKAGPNTSGEDMGTISLYRKGLQINFPTNAAMKGGSCIFIHVWRSPESPTSGCVALAEADVKELQEWAAEEPTIIVIAPERASGSLAACFPGVP